MTINESTIRQDIYNTIYTQVNTNISDPLSRSKQWIFNSFPDYTKSNFPGYPLIVINRAEIDRDKDTLDNSYNSNSFPLIITVYATSNIMCDQLSDSLDSVINSVARTQLTINDSTQDADDTVLNGRSVHYNIHTYNIEVDV